MNKKLLVLLKSFVVVSSCILILTSCGGGKTSTPTVGAGSSSSSVVTSSSVTSSNSSVPVVCTEACDNKIRINEAVSSNSIFDDENGDSEDWLELYNYGASNIDLAGWTLTDDINEPDKWIFPSYSMSAGEYLLVWASNKDRANAEAKIFHTNFKISSNGESIFIFNQNGTQVSSLLVENVAPEGSIGISANDTVVLYNSPTPGAPNNTNEFIGTIGSSVVFSHDGGAFDGATVTLSGAEGQEVIRYTLNANIPNKNSTIYNAPIDITANTVVRARIFQEDYIPSKTASRTYLVNNPHDLPIIALVTEPENFFSFETGIYEYGDSFSSANPHYGANFWEDWERDVHFSFYEKSGELGVALDAGIKIFGGWSRAHDQRSFSIFARGRYGFKVLQYPLFPSLAYDEFQAIVLRNSGNDWHRTMLRDTALTSLMAGSGLETQSYRPVAVYLNGQYWGLYNLREKINEHFLASRHDLDADDVDLLEKDGELIEGDNSEYMALLEYVNNNDLSIAENYAYVANEIDIDNYIAYQVAQIYFNNQDWPGNNIKFWKSPSTKWRWILFDTEFGTGIYNDNDYSLNALARALTATGPSWPNPAWSTFLFRRLVENTTFRNKLINHFADELNTRFLSENVTAHIDALAAVIASEIPLHYDRWNGWPNDWAGEVATMKASVGNRPAFVISHIQSQFGLQGTHVLSIINNQTSMGHVNVNSLKIEANAWEGMYFEGVSVTLNAVPADGFVFSHWQGAGNATTASIEVNLTEAATFSPVFSAAP